MASGHRYRRGKIKKEHSITEGTLPVLEQIASLDEVTGVIPGRISKATGGAPRVTFQYFTESGMKLLSRTITAVQEIFVICVDADGARAVKRKLREQGIVVDELESASPTTDRTAPKAANNESGGRSRDAGRRRRNGSPRDRAAKRGQTDASTLRSWRDDDDEALSHLGPRIDDETREALRRLKRRLR